MTSSDDNFHNGVLQPIKMQQKNAQNSHSLGNIAALNNGLKPISVPTKSRSREGINLSSHNAIISPDLKHKSGVDHVPHKTSMSMNSSPTSVNDSDLIITTARPATIISSTNAAHSMPNVNQIDENVLHIHEDSPLGSPHKGQSNAKGIQPNQHVPKRENSQFIPPRSLPLLPNTKDVDWSGLVDSAITQINEGLKKHYYDASVGLPPMTLNNLPNGNNSSSDQLHGAQSPSYESFSSISSSSSSSGGGNRPNNINNINNTNGPSVLPDLQNQVTQLEHAVRRLTEENRRLQNESQAAAQQLRQFSEWFFQTIDRQQ